MDISGLFGNGMDWEQIARAQAQLPDPSMVAPAATIGQAVPDPNMQSAIAPEFLAKNAAARGVPPPPVDFTPGDVGAALTGSTVPMPQSRPQMGGPGAPMDITSEAQKSGVAAPEGQPKGGLMDALKGVRAPAAPDLQRISSPAAPRPGPAIKGGDIIALLQSLGAGRGGGGLDLPSTLGQALMRK